MADAPPPPVRRTPVLVVTAAALLVVLAAATATAVDRPTQPRKLTLISTANGAALADVHGNPLYLREADKPNKPGCTGRCAALFPPAVGSPSRGHGVTGKVTHTPHHAQGSGLPQVVYVRHPLYYYAKDHPKRPRGQEVDGFRLVAPNGKPLPTGEIGTATSRPEPPPARPAKPPHTTTPRHPARTTRATAPARGKHPAKPTPPAPATAPHPHPHPHASATRSRTPGTGPRTAPHATPRPTRTHRPAHHPSAGTAPGTGTTAKDKVTAKATTTATATATARTTTTTTARATAGATIRPTRLPTPEPTAPRSASPAVGALQATPSGAANGGAVHPVPATAADRVRAAGAADIALALGATAAGAAGALVIVRRLRRDATGGER